MNNNPQNSKISDPHLRTAWLLFRLCLIGPSQAAGKGGGGIKGVPEPVEEKAPVRVHLCMKRILNLQSNTCGFVIHLPRHLLLWDISNPPFNIFRRCLGIGVFALGSSLLQELWSFSLFFCILRGHQLHSRMSTFSLRLWTWSTHGPHAAAGDGPSWKSSRWNLAAAFERHFHLQSAVPLSVPSRAPEQCSVVNASAPSSGSEGQLHCD